MKERREVHVPTFPMAASVTENGSLSGQEAWEDKCARPEEVAGLDLSQPVSPATLLTKVKELLADLPAPLVRQFRETAVNGDAATNGEDASNIIRIMQWNILADALSIGKDNFVRCPLEALQWSQRRLYILAEVLRVNPDVLTLQEVDHYGFFKHTLAACGYTGLFFPKPDSPTLYVKNNNGPDGCAMFYRTEKVEMLDEQRIVLKTMPGMNATNQVAIIVRFRLRDSDKTVCVATTHLKAKPGWEDLRQLQGTYLASYLEEHHGDQALVVCGDFNADYNEKVYSVFTQSKLGLSSAYREAEGTGEEPEYTTWKIRGSGNGKEKESKRTIDYVWFTQKDLTLKTVLEIPTAEQIGVDRLPSHSYPSDHLSLATDFVLK